MVKIIERKNEKRLGQEKRSERLIDIARETLPNYSIPSGDNSCGFVLYDGEPRVDIDVYLTNEIRLPRLGYLEDAVRLAKSFEDNGEGEFTIRKLYRNHTNL